MNPRFYRSVNEFIEEAIENLKKDLGEAHDAQYWAGSIYGSAKKLIDYGSINPKIATHEIFSNSKVCKEYYYWDDSCGGVLTSGHHKRVHVQLIECAEVIRACQEYLGKHKEVA